MISTSLNEFNRSPEYKMRSVIEFSSLSLNFEFIVYPAHLAKFSALKDAHQRARKDGLWQDTCFELFWSVNKTSYWEMNLAPNGDWQLYFFEDYRGARSEPKAEFRDLTTSLQGNRWSIKGSLFSEDIDFSKVSLFNPTVIIKDDDDVYFFAHRHPAAKPDFHLKDCWLKI